MGIFDFFKKKETKGTNDENKSPDDIYVLSDSDYEVPNSVFDTSSISYEKGVSKTSPIDEAYMIEERLKELEGSPSNQRIKEVVKNEAQSFADDVKKIQDERLAASKPRKDFEKKYQKIWHIFFAPTRSLFEVDEQGFSLDDRYNQLFGVHYYSDIPEDFLQYAYLCELNRNGLLKNGEKRLYSEIVSSKLDLASLYDLCVAAYGALGCCDIKADRDLFPDVGKVNGIDTVGDISRFTKEKKYTNLSDGNNQTNKRI